MARPQTASRGFADTNSRWIAQTCCQEKGFLHCGECPEFPCRLLQDFSSDPEHGDTPPGARIEQCRRWAERGK